MGVSVREKKPGSGEFWVFISHNGTRRARKVGSEELAREVAEKAKARLVLGDFGVLEPKPPSVTTFKKFAEQWLLLPNADWKESTRASYAHTLKNHVFSRIGTKPVDRITRKDLSELFNQLLLKGLAPRSVQLIKVTISGVFASAVEAELVKANPASGIKIRGAGAGKKKGLDIEPLNDAEAVKLLEQVRAYRHGFYYPAVLCALRTGMRIGEIQALEWADIDFNSRFISVARSFRKGSTSTTKNNQTRRVDMTPHLMETLKDLRRSQKVTALKKGRPVPELVFIQKNGKRLRRFRFREVFNRCLEKAGIRRIRIHDLRHSYATIRLMRGHNIGDVSRQLGHSSISITYDIYGHWVPGTFKSEVDELDGQQPTATYTQPEGDRNLNCV
jgi:integrase